MEDDEGAAAVGVGSRGFKLEVVDRPSQSVHTLLAAIDGHDHAFQVP